MASQPRTNVCGDCYISRCNLVLADLAAAINISLSSPPLILSAGNPLGKVEAMDIKLAPFIHWGLETAIPLDKQRNGGTAL